MPRMLPETLQHDVTMFGRTHRLPEDDLRTLRFSGEVGHASDDVVSVRCHKTVLLDAPHFQGLFSFEEEQRRRRRQGQEDQEGDGQGTGGLSREFDLSAAGLQFQGVGPVLRFLYVSRYFSSVQATRHLRGYLTPCVAQSVLEAAHFLHVEPVVDVCAEFVRRHLDHGNVADAANLSVKLGHDRLTTHCLNYIGLFFPELKEGEGGQINCLTFDAFLALTKHEDMKIHSENELFLSLVSFSDLPAHQDRHDRQKLYENVVVAELTEENLREYQRRMGEFSNDKDGRKDKRIKRWPQLLVSSYNGCIHETDSCHVDDDFNFVSVSTIRAEPMESALPSSGRMDVYDLKERRSIPSAFPGRPGPARSGEGGHLGGNDKVLAALAKSRGPCLDCHCRGHFTPARQTLWTLDTSATNEWREVEMGEQFCHELVSHIKICLDKVSVFLLGKTRESGQFVLRRHFFRESGRAENIRMPRKFPCGSLENGDIAVAGGRVFLVLASGRASVYDLAKGKWKRNSNFPAKKEHDKVWLCAKGGSVLALFFGQNGLLKTSALHIVAENETLDISDTLCRESNILAATFGSDDNEIFLTVKFRDRLLLKRYDVRSATWTEDVGLPAEFQRKSLNNIVMLDKPIRLM